MGTDRSVVDAFIEIPKGSRNKYEFDESIGRFRLDRVLYSSVHYPTDYGYIEHTLAPDGDHLDILVVVHEPTFPGCIVESRPVGGLDMADEKGSDFKVLAVPTGDPRFDHIHTLRDLAPHTLLEIEAFFATYKLLEPKDTEVLGWHEVDEAWDMIERSRAAWAAKES
ncbi:MAG: inorganic diphosphatase [Thermomicrobiales bacterium]|jgi:inorganic pyrophosphatase|nr:inorganic diphosphatase [Thermomicrobiales bacterium]